MRYIIVSANWQYVPGQFDLNNTKFLHHVSRKEFQKLLQDRAIECLDEKRRVWRSLRSPKNLLAEVNREFQESISVHYRALEKKENGSSKFPYWPNTYRPKPKHGWHSAEQWLARVVFYGWRCLYCNVELSFDTLTKDHRIPVSRGGMDWPSNLVPACQSCNSWKGAR